MIIIVNFSSTQQVRGMATLKQISIRLKSVKNIQKITQSMKMVAAAKYAKAEKELKLARPFGQGSQAFFEKVEAKGNTTYLQAFCLLQAASFWYSTRFTYRKIKI